MTVSLYILGLLIRHGSMHGYQIKKIIDEHISDFANIKIGNIYYHLNSMKKKGLVSLEVVTGEKNIDKSVYTITDSGRDLFHNLLESASNDISNFEFSFDSILYFREHINKKQLSQVISRKISILEHILQGIESHKQHVNHNTESENEFFAKAIFDHHLMHYKTELEWYKSLKEKL